MFKTHGSRPFFPSTIILAGLLGLLLSSGWAGAAGVRPRVVLTAPNLLTPGNGALVTAPVQLTWAPVTNATAYLVEISKSATFSPLWGKAQVTGTFLTLPGPPDGTLFFWRVRAMAGTVFGPRSVSFQFTTTGVQLLAPTLSSPANGATQVSVTPILAWTAVPGATIYRVEITAGPALGGLMVFHPTTNALALTTPLLAGVRYSWRVRGEIAGGDANDHGPFSVVFAFTTAGIPLTAPVLQLPVNGATGVTSPVTLIWSAVTGATGYVVEVSRVSTFSPLVGKALVTSPTLILTGPPDGTSVFWRVRAEQNGNLGPRSVAFSFVTAGVLLVAPTLLNPPQGATGVSLTPTLSWTVVPGATGYRVQVSRDSTFATGVTTFAPTTNQVTLPALAANTTFFWRARAVIVAGDPNDVGPFSLVFRFTTVP